MNPEVFMQQAIAVAKEARAKGGVAIGSVLVEDATGTVIAHGGSLVGVTKDPTSHAEINCIRAACTLLGRENLTGYTLYSTLEPCHMCLSCAAWARIAHIYFGAYRKDVNPDLFDTFHGPGDEIEAANMNLREATHMQAHGGVCEAECAALLSDYHDARHHTATEPNSDRRS